MAAPLNAPLSPFFSLTNGYTVRVSAVDPTTGATVATVVASDVSIAVDQSEDSATGAPPAISGALLAGAV